MVIFHKYKETYNFSLQGDQKVCKKQFASVLEVAQDQSWSPLEVKSGFQRSATHPVNFNVINPKVLVKKNKEPDVGLF